MFRHYDEPHRHPAAGSSSVIAAEARSILDPIDINVILKMIRMQAGRKIEVRMVVRPMEARLRYIKGQRLRYLNRNMDALEKVAIKEVKEEPTPSAPKLLSSMRV